MNLNSLNFKIVLGILYIVILASGLFFLLSAVDLQDLMSYTFIRENKDIILNYKEKNFLFFTIVFFLFSAIWVLMLGFGLPPALFAGFVFGKWWGTLILVLANTFGSTLLYILASFFFSNLIREKLSHKIASFQNFFNKNELFYYMCFRFIGGGGVPFPIQNILPVIFRMKILNYFLSTLLGIIPPTFVTVAFASGIESVIDEYASPTFLDILSSPEIYLPLLGFAALILSSFFVKKYFFKN